MDDLIRRAITILRGAWNRRWIGLIVAWVVAVGAAAAVFRMPDMYEASARIYVDTQSVLKPLMAGLAVQPNLDQQIMILSRTLISRPNVERLIRMADLDHGLRTKADQDLLVDSLMKTLEIKSSGRDNLYVLSFRDSQPGQAQRVVQSLTSIFVESSLGDKRKDSDAAKKFIEEQIKSYEGKLQEAENRLKEFKLRNMSVSGGQDGKDYFGRMGDISSALNQARLELREAENSRDALKRQIAGEEPVLLPDAPEASGTGVALPEIDGRIDTLKRNLDSMLQRFTEQHPDVVGTKRIIAELEEQKRQELASRKKPSGSSAASSINANPVYQQLKVSLAESEANVASLGTRVAEYQSRYNQLKDAARMVPQIEAEFTQLNRDYDIHKKNYDSLVGKRESASISGDMDSAGGMADFRLIDPPRVSPKPVAPNRLMLLSVALLFSLAAGAGASFLASQIWPTFPDTKSLRDVSGLPILGTVSMIVTEPLRRRERRALIQFLAALGALVSAFGAGLLALFLISARAV